MERICSTTEFSCQKVQQSLRTTVLLIYGSSTCRHVFGIQSRECEWVPCYFSLMLLGTLEYRLVSCRESYVRLVHMHFMHFHRRIQCRVIACLPHIQKHLALLSSAVEDLLGLCNITCSFHGLVRLMFEQHGRDEAMVRSNNSHPWG